MTELERETTSAAGGVRSLPAASPRPGGDSPAAVGVEGTCPACGARVTPAGRRGRRSSVPAEVVERVQLERAEGRSLQAIADGLNADGVATGQGGALWRPSSVRVLLSRSAS